LAKVPGVDACRRKWEVVPDEEGDGLPVQAGLGEVVVAGRPVVEVDSPAVAAALGAEVAVAHGDSGSLINQQTGEHVLCALRLLMGPLSIHIMKMQRNNPKQICVLILHPYF
jgi:hypothetical protein